MNKGNGSICDLTCNSQLAYGYDYEDRLVSAQKVGGGTDSYSYTGEGGRYYITDSLGSRLQCNDGEDPTAPLLYDGLNFFDARIGQTVGSSGTDVSYVSDSLGSTLGDIDSSHTVKENDVYDAFGNIVYAGSLFSYPNGESVLYGGAQGYHTDNDTGLIRCGNRYYNPYIGRFISQDPIGDGDNWYAYCDNDPVDGSYPDGLEPQSISGGYDPDGSDDGGNGSGFDSGGYEIVAGVAIGKDGIPMIVPATRIIPSTPQVWPQWSLPILLSTVLPLGGGILHDGPFKSKYRIDMGEKPRPDMHIFHGDNETLYNEQGEKSGLHKGNQLVSLPKKLAKAYKDTIEAFKEKAGRVGKNIMQEVEEVEEEAKPAAEDLEAASEELTELGEEVIEVAG